MCVLLVAGLIVVGVFAHADHGLLFGAVTVFTALTAVAAFVSVFTRKNVKIRLDVHSRYLRRSP